MPTITFLGGADTVTGSRFLVRNGAGSVLVDCGLFQGPRRIRELNWQDPFFDVGLPDGPVNVSVPRDAGYLPAKICECPSSDVEDFDDYTLTVTDGVLTGMTCDVENAEHPYDPQSGG